MSGHSKWATIHRQKEVKDAKRGAIFTKLAGAITVAVRQGGGGDPADNFHLRLAVEKARQFNMPKENINRAIEKGLGGAGGEQLAEAVFEGFLPGGGVVLVEALTDNKVRTAQQVRTLLEKGGGSLGGNGAVAYLFSQLGEVSIVNRGLGDEDELKIIDLGVGEIERGDGMWRVYCPKDRTVEVKKRLEELGFGVEGAELVMKPVTFVEVGENADRVEKIISELEDLEDVQKVWTNYA